jgi:hypothetical protein
VALLVVDIEEGGEVLQLVRSDSKEEQVESLQRHELVVGIDGDGRI